MPVRRLTVKHHRVKVGDRFAHAEGKHECEVLVITGAAVEYRSGTTVVYTDRDTFSRTVGKWLG